jgi:hypothetical protein
LLASLSRDTGFARRFVLVRYPSLLVLLGSSRSANRESLVSELGNDLHLTSEHPDTGTNRGNLSAVYVASLDSGDARLGHAEPIGGIGLVEPRSFSDLRKPVRSHRSPEATMMLRDPLFIELPDSSGLRPHVSPVSSH